MTDTAPVRPAATILLVRDEPEFEVLMVKRHHQIDFASGALVFPGGKTDPADHDPAWERLTVGWGEIEPAQRPLRIAAIREAYEEAGILIARHASGSTFHGDERVVAARAAVSKGEPLMALVAELDLRLDLKALTVFARWITPKMMPKRFDTWFYVVRANSDQLAVCDGWETVDTEWIAPAHAIRLAEAGERKVIFPTRMNLQLLAESASGEEAVRLAGARTLVTVEPQVEQRPEGAVLVIPANAGYGAVAEPLSAING
jgi:8-oxo-dGTP pyrophosphatase MutT (NUDIX family)